MSMLQTDEIARLFKQEFAKMVAVISRAFGLAHIELAEDIVGETFLAATEHWRINGMPANPEAWLYTVARRKALVLLRRKKILTQKILPEIRSAQSTSEAFSEVDFSSENIRDSQLRMMFAVCNPAIASEAQVGLALRILCGFGIEEIADAFLSNKETINKRLFRARQKLRSENIALTLPSPTGIDARLNNVLHTIYLLFSEGYLSSNSTRALRKELCFDAIRLALLLIEYPQTNLPRTNALLALMYFHASRFQSRESENHSYILYDAQDETLWDREMMARGEHFLNVSACGDELSQYHLEAGIAFLHCQKADSEKKWRNILFHYDLLMEKYFTPVVALNRVYAIYKLYGATEALKEMDALSMTDNHYYYTLLGELHSQTNKEKSTECYHKALALAKTETDRATILQKLKQ